MDLFFKLWDGDTSQDLVLVILLLLSFLLGAFLVLLLAYWPTTRRLRKEQETLQDEHNRLAKDHKDLSDRYTVLQAKFNQQESALQTATAQNNNFKGQIQQLKKSLEECQDQLELYKDSARNFKASNEELLKQYEAASLEQQRLHDQTEGMKGIIEEMVQEKESLQQSYDQLRTQEEQEAQQLKDTQTAYKAAQEQVKELEKDLTAALEQRTELKRLLRDTENTQALVGLDDNELRTKLVEAKAHLKDLEDENTDLMERLAPYLAAEQAEADKEAKIEQQLLDLWVEAEQNMSQDGFFVDYDRKALIEDEEYLKQALEDNQIIQTNPESEEQEPVLDWEEKTAMERALEAASAVMDQEGFYQDIQEEQLLDTSEPE